MKLTKDQLQLIQDLIHYNLAEKWETETKKINDEIAQLREQEVEEGKKLIGSEKINKLFDKLNEAELNVKTIKDLIYKEGIDPTNRRFIKSNEILSNKIKALEALRQQIHPRLEAQKILVKLSLLDNKEAINFLKKLGINL